MTIVSRNTRLIRVNGELIEFAAYPEHGAWYEHRQIEPGRWVRPGSVGSLTAPMLVGGEPDVANVYEIEVAYEDMEPVSRPSRTDAYILGSDLDRTLEV